MTGYVRARSDNLPEVNTLMISDFFVKCANFNIGETRGAKAKKSERENYGDAAVGYVEVKREQQICFVRGRVCPEHKVRDTGYTVVTKIDEEEETINEVQCLNCPASAGGCKHAIAFMMWLHRRSEEPSPTSVSCYWKKPPLANAITHVKFMKIKDVKSNSKEVEVEERNDFLNLVLKEMKERNHDCQLSRHYTVFDINTTASIHQMMIQFCRGSTSDVEEFLKLASTILTPELCASVNKATVDQYEAHIWGELRYGRATASKIYEIAKCHTPDGSLVERIMGVAKIRDTEAMQRGRFLEKKVIAVFEKAHKTKVHTSGLILDARYPILGASPDGIGDDFVVEVKCPTTEKARSRYVNLKGELAPVYNGQIQLQMFMTKLKRGKFLLARPNFERTNCFTEYDVIYDEVFTLDIIEKAMTFWKTNISPLLLKTIKK